MDINQIIFRIANKTSSNLYLNSLITDDIKAKFDINKDAKPNSKGGSSVVYVNNRENIVAFINTTHGRDKACENALDSVGSNSKILPEIFNVEYLKIANIPGDPNYVSDEMYEKEITLCVIEMEKLRPLTLQESHHFDNLHVLYEDYSEWDVNVENLRSIILKFKNPLIPAVLKLVEQAKSENISHDDLHSGNVAWGSDNELKFIDWESILFN